jgi:hypothetical protein
VRSHIIQYSTFHFGTLLELSNARRESSFWWGINFRKFKVERPRAGAIREPRLNKAIHLPLDFSTKGAPDAVCGSRAAGVAITLFLDVLYFVAINSHERLPEASMWLGCLTLGLHFNFAHEGLLRCVKTDTADKITSCLRGKIVVNLLVKVDIQFLDWESLGAV